MSLVLNVEILGEFKKLTAATTGAQTQLQKLNGAATKVSSGMNKVLGAIGIGFSLAAITRGLGDAIEAAERVQQSDSRLQQVAESMALFGNETATVTTKMKKYADQLELTTGVEAETTKLAQAKLLTFKELGKSAGTLGGQFDRATKASLDLAATGFGTIEANATQLGKALQDPVKGLASLARSGVTFTAQQKAINKALVEGGYANALVALGYAANTKAVNDQVKAYEKEGKSVNDLLRAYKDEMTPAQIELYKHYQEGNHILEAQDNVLKAIEEQVGGVAEATAKTSDKMRNAFGQIEDALGLELLPLLDKFSNWLATPEGQEKLNGLIQLVTKLTEGFVKMLGFVIDNKEAFLVLVGVVGTLTVGMKLYAAAATLGTGATTALGVAAKTALPALTAAIAALEAIKWLNENLSFSSGNIAASGGSQGALNFSGQSSGSSGAGGSNMTFTTPKKTTKTPTVVQNIRITGSQSAKQINNTLVKQAVANGKSKLLIDPRAL